MPNTSIQKLTLDVDGHMPIVFIGKLLASNSNIDSLHINSEQICDFECFNRLGASLAQNKTLKELSIRLKREYCTPSTLSESTSLPVISYRKDPRISPAIATIPPKQNNSTRLTLRSTNTVSHP